MAATRNVTVDRVKAAAIVAVLVTHAGPPRWSPQWTAIDEVLRPTFPAFHVPAFLIVAGLLYRTSGPLTWRDVGRRIVRVVVPYLVVMAALYAGRFAVWPGWQGLPFALATGESYGIFYFVPVLVMCVLFGWLVSRGSPAMLVALTVALLAYHVTYLAVAPPMKWPTFWGIRDPLGRFYFGFFACGWLALPTLLARARPLLLGSLAVAVLTCWTVWGAPPPWPVYVVPLRVVYTLALVALLWRASWSFPGMQFLSEASLGIYLLHRPVMDLLEPSLGAVPPFVRIVALTTIALAASVALCCIARVALGRPRARFWLGA